MKDKEREQWLIKRLALLSEREETLIWSGNYEAAAMIQEEIDDIRQELAYSE
jgi:hypothetical protein